MTVTNTEYKHLPFKSFVNGVNHKGIPSEGVKVNPHIATRYLWTRESERCQCTHHVETHKIILKDPFTAVCYGTYTYSTRPCSCREFVPYRNISEEIKT